MCSTTGHKAATVTEVGAQRAKADVLILGFWANMSCDNIAAQLHADVIEVARNYKFAVLAFPKVSPSFSGLISLRNGFASSTVLPPNALESWRSSLGTFHNEELSNTRLFLWALRESSNASILDHENRSLLRAVHDLWLGLLLAVPNFSCARVTLFDRSKCGRHGACPLTGIV